MKFPPCGLLLLALLRAGGAAAGPCETCGPAGPVGWWDDRALDPMAQDDHAPRIDVDGPGLSSRIGIAWERRSGVERDVFIAISDDGGCSFDARSPWPGPEQDRLPDIAVSQASAAVAVAFVRDDAVVASVSLDGGLAFPPPSRVATPAPVDPLTQPRLAMIPVAPALHVFVGWCEGGSLHLAGNLASGAAGSWTHERLSDRLVGYDGFADVEVAADTRSRDATSQSAVTLVFTALAPLSVTPEIFALRSNDSGATFFGDPADPLTRDVPARISDDRPGDRPAEGAVAAALDVSDDGTGEFYTWEAVVYTDELAMAEVARIDARAEEGAVPSTIADWRMGPGSDEGIAEPGRAAAVSVIPNPLSRPPSPELHAFAEVTTPSSREIAAWRGILDADAPARAVTTCPAHPLTGVAPPRGGGEVAPRAFTADEDLSHVFVAWEDSRGGGSGIFFKRTDTVVDPPTGVVAGPADCAAGGGLVVSWQLPAAPPNCDVDHVRLDYGLAPGATDGSVDVAPSPPATLAGLPQGATVYVRVSVVDQACNVGAAAEVSGLSAACAATYCPLPVGGTLRAARRPTEDDVELRWEEPPMDATHDAATSYDVHRSTALAQAGFAMLGTVAPRTFVDAGAALPGGAPRHFYLVIARNSCGTSGDEPLP